MPLTGLGLPSVLAQRQQQAVAGAQRQQSQPAATGFPGWGASGAQATAASSFSTTEYLLSSAGFARSPLLRSALGLPTQSSSQQAALGNTLIRAFDQMLGGAAGVANNPAATTGNPARAQWLRQIIPILAARIQQLQQQRAR